MAIIGKLIQRTTAISYKRNAKKGVEYKYQLEVLRKLLEQAKNTKFGVIINDAQIWEGSNCRVCDGKANIVTRFGLDRNATDEDITVQRFDEEHITGCGRNRWNQYH